MARQTRIVIPGQPLHIMHRGNNRQDVFKKEDDYQRFINELLASLEQSNCALHAYVLMPNHFHLLLTPSTEKSLPLFMQSLGRRYVRYFNNEYQRSGTLWEGRYKSSLIDSNTYLLRCSRHIEENPIRANLVTFPDEYKWSSYHHNALGGRDPLITEHESYKQIAATERARNLAYLGLFRTVRDNKETKLISTSIEKGEVLGSELFHQTIASEVGLKTKRSHHGGDRKSERYKQSNHDSLPIQ